MQVKLNHNNYLKGIKKYFLVSNILKDIEILMFFQSLCEFFKIYDDIVMCIESSIHHVSNHIFVFRKIISEVKKGVLLSEAFNRSSMFPNTVINIIRSGEKSNDLLCTFELVKDFINWKIDQEKKMYNAFIYPILLIVSFLSVIILFANFVIPGLIEGLSQVNIDLIKKFAFVNLIFKLIKYFLIVFFILISSIYILYISKINVFERILLKTFFFGDLYIYKNIYFLSYYINLALKNGFSICESMDISIDSFEGLFKEFLYKIKMEIVKGKELSSVFAKNENFPKLFIDIVRTGENSGNLKNAFLITHKIFYEKYNNSVNNIVEFLPIFFMFLISFLLIGFIFCIFLPIYDLGVY